MYTKEERYKMLEECFNSTVTVDEYALEHGVTKSDIYSWRKQYQKENGIKLKKETNLLSKKERFRMLEECFGSSISVQEYASKYDLSVETIYKWRKEYEKVTGIKLIKTGFLNQEERFKILTEFYSYSGNLEEYVKKEGISEAAFYKWKSEYEEITGIKLEKEKSYSQEERFAIVKRFYDTEISIREFERSFGLYDGAIMSWKSEYERVTGEKLGESKNVYSSDEIQEIVEGYYTSFMSMADYAYHKGVSMTALRDWKKLYELQNGIPKEHEGQIYTQEERYRYVEECFTSEKSVKEYAIKAGISQRNLYKWRKEYEAWYGNKIKKAGVRSKEERDEFVEAFIKSNMSVRGFSKENGLQPDTLSRWIKDYEKRRGNKVPGVGVENRQRYSKEEWYQIVVEAYTTDITIRDCAKKYDTSEATIRVWKKRYETETGEDLSGN